MPSMRCYECKEIKRCTMVLERDENGATVGVYYCAKCRRALQALRDDGPDAAYNTLEERDLARDEGKRDDTVR